MRTTVSMASTNLACSWHQDSALPLPHFDHLTRTQFLALLGEQFDEVQQLYILLSPGVKPVKQYNFGAIRSRKNTFKENIKHQIQIELGLEFVLLMQKLNKYKVLFKT